MAPAAATTPASARQIAGGGGDPDVWQRLLTPPPARKVEISALYDDVRHCHFGSAHATARRKMDPDIFARLITPPPPSPLKKEFSAIYDECRNCTFQPTISANARAIVKPPFMKRVPAYIERFHELHNKEHKLEPKMFPFKPQINHSHTAAVGGSAAAASSAAAAGSPPHSARPASASASGSRASFLARVAEDQRLRSLRAAELVRDATPPFKPEISSGSLRRLERARNRKGIPHSFLERLEDDLERREELERAQIRQRNSVPFSFTPDRSLTAGGTGDRGE
jgi:hypothetical protein